MFQNAKPTTDSKQQKHELIGNQLTIQKKHILTSFEQAETLYPSPNEVWTLILFS